MSQQSRELVRVSDLKRLIDGDKQALATVRQNPGAALALLSQVHQTDEMNMGHQSRVMEVVVGEVADIREARQIIDDNLMSDHARELHAYRGDLASVMDVVATADDLITALLVDLRQYRSGQWDASLCSFYIRGWAQKIRDRKDWKELLSRDIFGFTLRDHLIIACYHDSFSTVDFGDEEENVTDDMFVELGLEPEESRERLREILDEGIMPEIDPYDLAEMQQAVANRRKQIEDDRLEFVLSDADELDI